MREFITNILTGARGLLHHCAFCKKAMSDRCKKEGHWDYCTECGHIFSVLKGCQYHSYVDGFNRPLKLRKLQLAGVNNVRDEDPEAPELSDDDFGQLTAASDPDEEYEGEEGQAALRDRWAEYGKQKAEKKKEQKKEKQEAEQKEDEALIPRRDKSKANKRLGSGRKS